MKCQECKRNESTIKIYYEWNLPDVLCRTCYLSSIMDSIRRYKDRHLDDLITMLKTQMDNIEHI